MVSRSGAAWLTSLMLSYTQRTRLSTAGTVTATVVSCFSWQHGGLVPSRCWLTRVVARSAFVEFAAGRHRYS